MLRDALKPHRSTLTPKLWTVLESAKPGDASLLPAASALASYDPDNAKWEAVGGKVAQALVSVNSIYLGPWLEALRPVRGKLTAPLASIFQEKHPESEHTLATNILTDYASDDPDRLAELLMVVRPEGVSEPLPGRREEGRTGLACLPSRACQESHVLLERSAARSIVDETRRRPREPDRVGTGRYSPSGSLSVRQCRWTSSSRPPRLSANRDTAPCGSVPMPMGRSMRVAAVWTRDGRNWRISSGLTADEVRQQDERNKKDKFLPVDVAGYVATSKDGKPADRYAALWVEKTGDDDARMYVGMTADEQTEVQDKLKEEKLIPRTLHAMIGADGRTRYCGVWGRPPGAAITGQTYRDQFEGNFEQNQARPERPVAHRRGGQRGEQTTTDPRACPG